MLYNVLHVVISLKASDIFKSMDEVRAYVNSMKSQVSEEDYELLQMFFGILENQGISETVVLNGEEVKIDKYLVPMVLDLNSKGIETRASCSGLLEEHPQDRFRPKSGYISFGYSQELFDKLQDFKDDMVSIIETECFLTPAISITVGDKDNHIGDDLLKEKWQEVWSFLVSCVD